MSKHDTAEKQAAAQRSEDLRKLIGEVDDLLSGLKSGQRSLEGAIERGQHIIKSLREQRRRVQRKML
ncbi:MAG: hypothetical protein GY772_00780 [bacterium]|nr:hypothetical protein [bacterium]